MRWCWVNFQCWGVLLIWIRVGQWPTALIVGAGGGCLDIFSLSSITSLFSLPLSGRRSDIDRNTVSKGRLTLINQPTNQPANIRNNFLGTITLFLCSLSTFFGGGRVVRWYWVSFQCRGVLQLRCSRARVYCTCSSCGWGLFVHF